MSLGTRNNKGWLQKSALNDGLKEQASWTTEESKTITVILEVDHMTGVFLVSRQVLNLGETLESITTTTPYIRLTDARTAFKEASTH